jgi:hypothetical protein
MRFYNADCRDWSLPDPHGKGLESVKAVRDSIIPLVDALIVEFVGSPPS